MSQKRTLGSRRLAHICASGVLRLSGLFPSAPAAYQIRSLSLCNTAVAHSGSPILLSSAMKRGWDLSLSHLGSTAK